MASGGVALQAHAKSNEPGGEEGGGGGHLDIIGNKSCGTRGDRGERAVSSSPRMLPSTVDQEDVDRSVQGTAKGASLGWGKYMSRERRSGHAVGKKMGWNPLLGRR